jgi:hypothetical protein
MESKLSRPGLKEIGQVQPILTHDIDVPLRLMQVLHVADKQGPGIAIPHLSCSAQCASKVDVIAVDPRQ